MGGMTEAAVDTPLAPLPLTPEQLAAIYALNPAVFAQLTGQEAEPERPKRVIVKPVKESRLEALLCTYRTIKDEAAAAEAKLKELKTAITAEVEAMYPDEKTRPSEGYEIPETRMWPPLTISYKSSEYLPAAKIREFLPEVWKAFKGTKSWSEVREAGQRRGGGKR